MRTGEVPFLSLTHWRISKDPAIIDGHKKTKAPFGALVEPTNCVPQPHSSLRRTRYKKNSSSGLIRLLAEQQ